MATGTAIEVVMPQMGVSVSEGTITKWLKQPGETVAADEPLLEISTDKVDTEVPSPGSGVVQEILVPEGETVEVGTVLATIVAEGDWRRSAASARLPPPSPSREPSAHDARRRSRASRPPSRRLASENGKTFVSPVVARIAAEHGVDPDAVPGTGRGGRVTKKDILSHLETEPQPPRLRLRLPAAPAAPPPAGSRGAARGAGPGRGRRDRRADDARCAAASPSTCAARSTPRRT